MEELQNLRSDSEILESKIAAPLLINIIKLIVKLSIASLALISFFYDRSCGKQMQDVIHGSCIFLYIESLFVCFFMFLTCFSEKCVIFASYSTIFKMVIEVALDIFYVAWGIYVVIIYFNENKCNQNMNVTDVIGLAVMIYFLVALSLKLCFCGAKVCICLSTLLATAKTDVDRSISHDLVSIRNSFRED